MALLAETLVDEWLNRVGFFTIRGVKDGVDEIDLLGVRPVHGQRSLEKKLEGWHVEVQISFRPVGYITPLTDDLATSLKKKKTSAWERPKEVLAECVRHWVDRKFKSKNKFAARDRAWPGLEWQGHFVHGVVRDKDEVSLIRSHGIQTVSFYNVLASLCSASRSGVRGAAGTDIAEVVAYYESIRNKGKA